MGKAGSRSHKFWKIAIVLFLTVLIWVWADLELDETRPEKGAVIRIDESSNDAIWVSFSHKVSADIRVTLSGPHSAFTTLDRELRSESRKLAFVFDAEHERMTEPGKSHSFRVLDFVQKNKKLKDLGLKVESCLPEVIDVNVVALVKIPLQVKCFTEDGQSLDVESIPSTVEMFAPEGTRTAQVRLSDRDIDRARLAGVEKTPFIVLAEGWTKEATRPVRIMIASEQVRLPVHTISPASLDVALSPGLAKEYRVEVTNLTQIQLGPITIKATEEAKRRYENQQLPHMTLHIFDSAAKKAEVVYNFPKELVRSGEIELVKSPTQPAVAEFKLILLIPGDAPPSGVE